MKTGKRQTFSVSIAATALVGSLVLSGCGGGSPTGSQAVQPRGPETHVGTWRQESNGNLTRAWYGHPQVDLPKDGADGLRVKRPEQGGAAGVVLVFSPTLNDRLEPRWRFDSDARDRLAFSRRLIWLVANQAYQQWARHLDYDPGSLALVVGTQACGHDPDTIACYRPDLEAAILSEDWIARNYEVLQRGLETESKAAYRAARENLFIVLTHEVGHQFGYENPDGATDGCGELPGCHAPGGSGSVMSYDHLQDRAIRYHVTEEDILHVPDATWNVDGFDEYTVWKSAEPSSIDEWGVWIRHYFEVDGETEPGRLWGGNLSIVDEIGGAGWVEGMPSQSVSLPGAATWSGEDNFLGVDFDPDYLGALLRADANLRYTFGARPNMHLEIDNFEAHYASDGDARWYDHARLGKISYDMDCAPVGCSGHSAEAKWYRSDAGDPSGWVGGVVNDEDNGYSGSFVAEKD